jgi:peptidylprolyl isomerase
MRSLPALAAAAVAATLLLAGCAASGPDPSATGAGSTAAAGCADSGSASKSVTVAGDVGAAPTTTFQGPYSIDTTERSIVTEGDGVELQTGDYALIDFAMYNGSTGKEVYSNFAGSGQQPLVLQVDEKQFLKGIVEAVNCVKVGSRVVAVIPPAEGFGDQGNTDLGVSAADSLVMVADVRMSSDVDHATGEDQAPEDGFPSVALDDTAMPTITIPQADPPTDLALEVLKKGDGSEVADGDTVMVQYQGVIWRTGAVFDHSWNTRGPVAFGTKDVVKGFSAGLVGQTVGSQVLVVIPPDLGYGAAGNSTAGIQGTDTLVFVVDILATGATPDAG